MSKLCGFIGNVDRQEIIEERLRLMIRVMKHDSNSHEEYLWLENGGIAVIRNTPFDKNQSMWGRDRLSCLALSGHIVDYESHRSAVGVSECKISPDVEFLHQAFEERGEEILERLNGVFSMAYYSSRSRSLTIANDRYGFSPLYYYHDNNGFWFASEVKAILRVIGRQEPDWESYADFFYAGHMTGQKTLFQNICALDSGQMLMYCDGSLHKRKYYDFTQTPVAHPKAISTKELASLFIQAVQRRVIADKPGTVLLSGGFDSRLILGALHRLGVSPKLLSLEHGDEKKGADGRYASLIASHLGLGCELRRTRPDFYTSHDCLEVFYILDGMVPTWNLFIGQVYSELDSSLGVIWEGIGLGSALGGGHQREGGINKNLDELLEKRAKNRALLKEILTPEAFHALDSNFTSRIRREIDKIPVSENQFLHFLLQHRIRRRISPNPHQLFATKVEARTPGTDRDFMDYVLSIPNSLRLNHRIYIDLMRESFPSLTKVPVISGGSVYYFDKNYSQLTNEFVDKTQSSLKQILKGFNVKRKFKSLTHTYPTKHERHLSRLVISILREQHFDRPFYNREKLSRLFTEYCNGNPLYHDLFMIVFHIELWHLLFQDENSPILFDTKGFELVET
jgi:asparagine synthetase B (glutamine-hydrolysing)